MTSYHFHLCWTLNNSVKVRLDTLSPMLWMILRVTSDWGSIETCDHLYVRLEWCLWAKIGPVLVVYFTGVASFKRETARVILFILFLTSKIEIKKKLVILYPVHCFYWRDCDPVPCTMFLLIGMLCTGIMSVRDCDPVPCTMTLNSYPCSGVTSVRDWWTTEEVLE